MGGDVEEDTEAKTDEEDTEEQMDEEDGTGERTDEGDAEESTDEEEDGSATGPLESDGQERPHLLLSDLNAGCTWDAENWSCAYDAVYMVFYVMYGMSNPTWRAIWTNESPEWNVPLARQFDLLLADTATGQYPSAMRCQWFSGCRNAFRGQAAESNPTAFTYGHSLISVSALLERIFKGPSMEPLSYQSLSCQNCEASKKDTHYSFPYLGFKRNINRLRKNGDSAVLPVQVVVDRFIERYSTTPFEPHETCATCHSPRRVTSLHLPEQSWIWFEQTPDTQTLYPSLELSCSQPAAGPTHTLAAIIYNGMLHFTARIRKGGDTWWNYDGQKSGGVPTVATFEDPGYLSVYCQRYPAFLIYRRLV